MHGTTCYIKLFKLKNCTSGNLWGYVYTTFQKWCPEMKCSSKIHGNSIVPNESGVTFSSDTPFLRPRNSPRLIPALCLAGSGGGAGGLLEQLSTRADLQLKPTPLSGPVQQHVRCLQEPEQVNKGLTSHSTLYRSTQGQFLQVRWPNQQRQSAEGSRSVGKRSDFSPTTPPCYNESIQVSEWVSSFLTAHQHIEGHFSAIPWC